MRFKEDQEYLEQTRSGNMQGFAMLVEKYERMVFTICLRMLKNREEAEEACQDAFVKGYQNLSGFSGNSKFGTWVYKIAYNECLGKLRKKKYTFEVMEEITEGDSDISLDNGLEILIAEEREKLIKKAIELLSPNEAVTITLFYLEELTIKEIAAISSMSESNLKVLLHRGRKNLASALQKIAGKEMTVIK